jgi:hypothetical protein
MNAATGTDLRTRFLNEWGFPLDDSFYDQIYLQVEQIVAQRDPTADVRTVNLPKTGQTKCYDTTGKEISCTGTGQNGEIQAGVAWPEPRFITNADFTIQDNLTGLVWAFDGNIMPTRDPGWDADGIANDGRVTWQHALDYVTKLNSENYLEHNDWRLPNVNELESLENADEANPATWLNAQGFTKVQAGDYWSSTICAEYPEEGTWYVSMWSGYVSNYSKSNETYVWPVCGGQSCNPDPVYPSNIWKTGQTISYYAGDDGDLEWGVAWPVPRFTDLGNGTVGDNLTGLIWAKSANLPGGTWQQALDYVTSLNSGHYLGYSDWRLPNRKELHSLTDFSQYGPALPAGHPFTNVQADAYWSSTTIAFDSGDAWYVRMNSGSVDGFYKSGLFSVWPVRGGQIECSTWTDVISKYNAYVGGQVVWNDVITCYTQYTSIYAQECTIDWSGYNYSYDYPESGSARTSETSMTEQAAREARDAIFGGCDDGSPYVEDMGCSYNCCTCAYSHYVLSEYSHACLDGQYLQNSVYITESGPVFTTLRQGTWIVTCQTLVVNFLRSLPH